MSFFHRLSRLTLRDKVRSSFIQEGFRVGLRVEQLLLHVERIQTRGLGHLIRIPPERLPGEVFKA